MSNRLYLGVPGESWDSLSMQAEDILAEEKIGQHLLGVYPAGPRMYGDSSCLPGLLCIYIDEPLALLDPTKPSTRAVTERVTQEGSRVWYAELYSWVKTVVESPHQPANELTKTYIHIIPTMSEAHYVGEEMAYISSLADDYLSKSGWDIPHSDHGYLGSPNLIQEAAYLRSRVLLQKKRVFAPCLNRNWDQIEQLSDIPEHITEIDSKIIEHLSSGQNAPTTADLVEFCDWAYNWPWALAPQPCQREAEELGAAVSKLLYSLL